MSKPIFSNDTTKSRSDPFINSNFSHTIITRDDLKDIQNVGRQGHPKGQSSRSPPPRPQERELVL